MSDRPSGMARMPSWPDTTRLWPGSWCRTRPRDAIMDGVARTGPYAWNGGYSRCFLESREYGFKQRREPGAR
jgi:hypothetical protein